MHELKTSEDWSKTTKWASVKVLDPDGWNRSNWQFSWHEEFISEKEYEQRLMRSTTQGMPIK